MITLTAMASLLPDAVATASGCLLTGGVVAVLPAAAAAAPAEGAVGTLPMAVLGIVMLATYALIATGRLHKLTAALCGAIVCVLVGLLFGVLHEYEEVHAVLAKDIGVLGVIVGTSILVDVAGKSGLFQFLAVKIAKKAKGDPQRLFTSLVILTVLFVSLLTIAPGTLIVVSLSLVLCRTLQLDPKPYLVGVAICANSGALVTFASGICTLMVGSAAKLPYAHFFLVSTPMALATAAVAWWVVKRFYRDRLIADPATREEREAAVASFDEWAMVSDRRVFWRSAGLLLLTIAGFASAQAFGVGLDFVAMAGGAAAILFSGQNPEEAVKKVNWTVIVFFIGLFVMIGTVEHSGLLQQAAGLLSDVSGGNVHVASIVLVIFTAVTSGIMDNIPVAATMIPIVATMTQELPAAPLWWGLTISANLGGNGTPIGSISGVIALSALQEGGHEKVTWGEWFKVGGVTMALQLVVVIVWLTMFTVFDLYPELPGPS
ncbi:MAG: SLC13 family permease [Planctomycetota bacterium]